MKNRKRLCFTRIATLACLVAVAILLSCSSGNKPSVDRYNDLSYASHYRNLDSTEFFARQALRLSDGYDDGEAEAYNNLAFASLARMDYALAARQLDSVNATDNQIELLVADIQMMKLCQRQSKNKDFYTYNERATRRLKRINEDNASLTPREQRRMTYARSEYAINSSVYYYYVGLERQSVSAIKAIDEDGELQQDTAQFLNYLYNVGAGGVITVGAQDSILQAEMGYLVQCYFLAQYARYPYWQANALQAISEHLTDERYGSQLLHSNYLAMNAINQDGMPDSLLAGNFAQHALDMFNRYGDVYQTAGAYRTLAQCFERIGDYRSSLICLNDALKVPGIDQAPEMVASIREQLSVVYSSVNDKPQSDYNRNIYLDLQEQTRQDRYFESRADQLSSSIIQLNLMIGAVIVLIIIIAVLLFLLNRYSVKREKRGYTNPTDRALELWKEQRKVVKNAVDDSITDAEDRLAMSQRESEGNHLRYIEQRAKIGVALSVMPLIDRLLHEMGRMETEENTDGRRAERIQYVRELTDCIGEYNTMLTQWIQLRQGEVRLNITTFPVMWLFELLSGNRSSFARKGIKLVVNPTTCLVKADRVLTLFMLNTIADNARKFTPSGGQVVVSAHPADDSVEISVQDTGCGMTEAQCKSLFDHKSIADQSDATAEVRPHGFGLMNCKGIIEKYKKTSSIFKSCSIGVDSRVGEGTRIFFRLPKGVARMVVTLVLLVSSNSVSLGQNLFADEPRDTDLFLPPVEERIPVHLDTRQQRLFQSMLHTASNYSDSAYQANLTARYADCVTFADSCRKYLNAAYHVILPQGKDVMLRIAGLSHLPAEIVWLHQGLPIDFGTILEIRNETAVAALALHDMPLYEYNNKAYTQLFKEKSADRSLGEYCYKMKRSETNKGVAVVLLVILLILLFPAYYLLYFRHRLYYRFYVERMKGVNDILASSQPDKDKLVALEHIDFSRYPQSLQSTVDEVRAALTQAAADDLATTDQLRRIEEETKKAIFESQRFYTANNVLDNCLSSLKHETMYYPATIRQQIDNPSADYGVINQLGHYYKRLYSLFLSQAMSLLQAPMACESVRLSDLLPRFSVCSKGGDLKLIGDGVAMRQMFSLLKLQNAGNALTVEAEQKDNYVAVKVTLDRLTLDTTQCQDLFSPLRDNIPYFICRQIVRDNGEQTNRRSCGITESPSPDGGTCFMVMLAAAGTTHKQNTI